MVLYTSCLTPGSYVCTQSEDHRQLDSSTVSGRHRSSRGLLPVWTALLGHRCCSTYHHWGRRLCDRHHRSAALLLLQPATELLNWLFRQTFNFLFKLKRALSITTDLILTGIQMRKKYLHRKSLAVMRVWIFPFRMIWIWFCMTANITVELFIASAVWIPWKDVGFSLGFPHV